MPTFVRALIVAAPFLLSGCGGAAGTPPGRPLPQLRSARAPDLSRAAPLTQLVNLAYTGVITVFSIQNGRAIATKTFDPGHGAAQGLAVDASGRIYTTITASDSRPCAACVEIFNAQGTLLDRLPAPILSGAPGPPSLSDVSVDEDRNVYVSDDGQQAVYVFPHARGTRRGPTIVEASQNAESLLATPNGADVVVSGNCGFGSVRPYARIARGRYMPGSCFSIATIALIGGAADDRLDVMTPVDGAVGDVAVSSPSGEAYFHTPDREHAEISGVAFNRDGSVAYVANHRGKCVYAFARPAKGWLSGAQPKLLGTYVGFESLGEIAVSL